MEEVWVKIQRANYHAQELKRAVHFFFDTTPYAVSTNRGADGKLFYYVSKVDDLSPAMAAVIGDIIQNLRSALDHIAYRLFIQNGGDKNTAKHIYFPIFESEEKYNSEMARKTKGISAEAIKIIDSIKPYKECNRILWLIHELNNLDKHRLLLTAGSSFNRFDVGEHIKMHMGKGLIDGTDLVFPETPLLFLSPANKSFPLKVGDVLFVDGANSDEIPTMKFEFDIVFHETGIIENESVLETIVDMIDEAKKVVSLFK